MFYRKPLSYELRKAPFLLGQIVATAGAILSFAETICLFGKGFRILSAYSLKTGVKIRIITEADRSTTRFLLPDDY
jgi:hypothetical protein